MTLPRSIEHTFVLVDNITFSNKCFLFRIFRCVCFHCSFLLYKFFQRVLRCSDYEIIGFIVLKVKSPWKTLSPCHFEVRLMYLFQYEILIEQVPRHLQRIISIYRSDLAMKQSKKKSKELNEN